MAPAAPGAAPTEETAHPSLCEVEFAGVIKDAGKLPPKHRWLVFATQGDCLAKDPYLLGTAMVTPEGKFYSEVFTKWGSDVSFCVAAIDTMDKPSTLYGKAQGTFHAEKAGEVEFKDLVIIPKPGPKRIFPAQAKDPLDRNRSSGPPQK